MSRRNQRAAAFSVAFAAHALLFMLAIQQAKKHQPPPPLPQHGGNVSTLVGIIYKPITPIITVKPQGEGLTQHCPKGTREYFGVGFIYFGLGGEVLNVPQFTPAYNAGIRVGDLMLADETRGDYLDITLQKPDHHIVKLHIRGARVCYK